MEMYIRVKVPEQPVLVQRLQSPHSQSTLNSQALSVQYCLLHFTSLTDLSLFNITPYNYYLPRNSFSNSNEVLYQKTGQDQSEYTESLTSSFMLTVNQRDLQGHQIELLFYTVYVRQLFTTLFRQHLMIAVKVEQKKKTLQAKRHQKES